MTHLTVPTGTPVAHRQGGRSFRPWWRWLLTALAFPPSGYIAHLVAGRVDSVPAAALNGVIAGTGIGAAQWALLRHRDISAKWIVTTAVGFGTGLAAGAAVVSYRTDITSLALMGAVTGLGVGIAQGADLTSARRSLGWSVITAALFALGWTITTAGGIDVALQWAVFGAYGCTTVAFLQSTIIGSFIPSKAEATINLKVTS
jgi:hypothetical protein